MTHMTACVPCRNPGPMWVFCCPGVSARDPCLLIPDCHHVGQALYDALPLALFPPLRMCPCIRQNGTNGAILWSMPAVVFSPMASSRQETGLCRVFMQALRIHPTWCGDYWSTPPTCHLPGVEWVWLHKWGRWARRPFSNCRRERWAGPVWPGAHNKRSTATRCHPSW